MSKGFCVIIVVQSVFTNMNNSQPTRALILNEKEDDVLLILLNGSTAVMEGRMTDKEYQELIRYTFENESAKKVLKAFSETVNLAIDDVK